MIFTTSQKNVGQSVLKSETLHIAQYLPQSRPLLSNINNESVLGFKMDSFPSQALLCSKDELALLNMRWYLTHLLKVLHLCWFNKRNNKRVLFVDDCDTLISQSVLISQFIKGQLAFVTRKNKYKGIDRIAKKNNFYLLNNPIQSKKLTPGLLLDQLFSKPKAIVTQEPERGGIDKMTLLFGNQLFGLIQRSKSTDKKPKPTLTFAPFGVPGKAKTKMNVFIACQNSRLSMCSTKSNDLIGLFSNSTVAFKTNYLMLNNLLALTFDPDSPLVVNQRSWSGFMHKRKSLAFDHNLLNPNPNGRSQTTAYERMIRQWYKKELTLIAKSPWKLEADMVFFTNPGKTYAMVEQIRRLGIPTSGLVDGSQITQRSKSPYGLSAPNHCVDYAIIGNANSNYFLRSVLAKCLALAKKDTIKQPSLKHA
jgi:hypothetical protein